ncbi:MAG TPA: hypothetical protein VN909_03710 [Candidatus Dormibacteraeota bacterium]|nr:hypothetical protein [Candidatus Dormibacteraeota bacterium]
MNVPILYALPLFALGFAVIAVAAHSVLRLFLSPERLSEHHEVAGFLMGVVGVLYSVVLGLLVGTVWTGFASAQQNSDLEAGYVADAFNYAGQVQYSGRREELQALIARYAVDVRNTAWSEAQRRQDPTAMLLYRAVRLTVTMPAPARSTTAVTLLEGNTIQDSLLQTLRSLADARRLRAVQSESRLPPGMLEALVLGAIAVISFTFFFGVRNYFKQMAMTALLAGSIGLFFGLILELSSPYSGAVQVSRDAWTFVIESNHLAEFAR